MTLVAPHIVNNVSCVRRKTLFLVSGALVFATGA